MTRQVGPALLILVCMLTSVLADEKQPAVNNETGLVKVEVQGKLVRQDNRYCVQAKNPVFKDTFLIELIRTEDKNQELNEHIRKLEGHVVIVRGVLRFSAKRLDGPELGIPIQSEAQVQKAK